MQLGGERPEGAFGEMTVKVCHHSAYRWRKLSTFTKSASTLVVDEDEIERVGPIADRKTRYQRLQQLALP